MATNNMINTKLSGATGTGSIVGAVSPTLVSPTLGVATATSINFGASGTDGIKGVTNGGNAASGYVGEYISASLLVGSKISLTNGNFKTLTSISLTAGDWDVCGTVCLEFAGATSTVRNMYLSLTNDAAGTAAGTNNNFVQSTEALAGETGTIAYPIGVARFSFASTTTVYLVGRAEFSAGTVDGYGFIGARRVR